MEVNNELSHKHIKHHFLEDFGEEEENDEENRFIISLDDIDLKEEFNDEIEKNPHGSNVTEKIVKETQDTLAPFFPKPLSLTESSNLASLQTNENVIGNKNSSLGESQEINVVSRESNLDVKKQEQNVKSKNMKESLGGVTIGETTSVNLEESRRSDNFWIDVPLQRQSVPAHNSSLTGIVSNDKTNAFQPHASCSSVICHQGSGISVSNNMPKAVKRKCSASDYPNRVKNDKKLSSPMTSLNTSSNNHDHIITGTSKAAPISALSLPITEVSPASGSCFKGDNSYQNSKCSSSSVLIRNPVNTSNYFFIVPSTSGSSNMKTVPTSGHQITPLSLPLPVLTPRPNLPSSAAKPAFVPSVVSNVNLCSNSNFILTPSSVTSRPTTKINASPSPTEKTQIVLVNKSSLDHQVADLRNVLAKATKVDLSKPGLVLVHFKPSSKTPTNSSSIVSPISSPSSDSLSLPVPLRENTLFGLVKSHLTQPLSQKHVQKTSLTNVSSTAQNGSALKRKNSSPCKARLQYSLVNQRMVQSSQGQGLGSLPPPPPLLPRPTCDRNEKMRQGRRIHTHSSNPGKEQTETMVLPILSKGDRERTPSNGNVGIPKQDESPSSPGLFIFSSACELSPQKDELSFSNLNSKASHNSPQVISSGYYRDHQFEDSCKYHIPTSTSSSLFSSPMSSSNDIVKSSSSCPVPCLVTSTGQSVNLRRQECMLVTSSALRPHMMTKSYPPKIQHNNSTCANNFSTSPALSSDPSSSVSLVSGLKMKIRLKDSQLGDKDDSANHEDITKQCEALKEQNETLLPSAVVPQNSLVEASNVSESSMDATVGIGAHIETAEEMFKRCEDQAMQLVYNAQFGVGEIQRNLRPNRTTTATNSTDFLYAHSGTGKGFKKKKSDEERSKTKPEGLANIESSIDKNLMKVRRKRALSGEEQVSHLSEKCVRLDINQYPKLMQDNSIVNRKTIYTPNILAGHKVYVKFNVFSNHQSGRSFLVPFFNIGGSRTQFDVEDMEYINEAVVDFEKDEKSCARHLLYYSREGNKAVFLRKESRLHSYELSPKSYKKHSFILEGHKRERPKQINKPVIEWKVDKVQIEIDRPENECEVELPVNNVSENCIDVAENTQTTSLGQITSTTQVLRDTLHHGKDNSPTPSSLMTSKNSLSNNRNKSLLLSSNIHLRKSTGHRDRVNILRKRNISGIRSPVQSCRPAPETNFNFTETLKKVVLSEVQQGNLPCETQQKQNSIPLQSCNPIMQNTLIEQQEQAVPESHILPHIKTEVHDDEYDLALTLKQKESLVPSDLIGISIKSEPIYDFSNVPAEKMNTSLNKQGSAIQPEETKVADTAVSHNEKLLENLHLPSADNQSVRSETLTNQTSEHTQESANLQTNVQHKNDEKTLLQPPGVLSLDLENLEKESSFTNTSLINRSPTERSFAKSSPCDNSIIDGNSCDNGPTAGDAMCSLEESDNIDDSSSIPDSSTITAESSDMTSSSYEEMSQDDEDYSSRSNTSGFKGSARSPSFPFESKIAGSTGNNKIMSLVESLKQRLTENSTVLPPLLPQSDLKLKKKKKKKKIQRTSKNRGKVKGSTSSVSSIVATSFPNHRLSNSSQKTFNAMNKADANLSELSLSLPSTSSLSSLSILQSSPPSHAININTSQGSAVIEGEKASISKEQTDEKNKNCKTAEVNPDGIEKTDFSSSSISKESVKGNGIFIFNLDHLSKETPKDQSKMKDISDSGTICDGTQNIISKQNPKSVTSDKKCEKISDLGMKNDERKKTSKQCEHFTWSSTGFPQSTSKGSPGDAFLFNRKDVSRRGQGREDEVQVKQDPESRPSSPLSFSDVEVDVGTDEFTAERPMKLIPTPSSLLSSPPIPNLGRNHIKDFTREHDLMVPFVNACDTKYHPKKNIRQMAKKPVGLSSRRKFKIVQNSTNEKSPIDKASQHDSINEKLKPSMASLLCEKLAIEVEPVVPKIKNVKGSPVQIKCKKRMLPSQNQDERTSSPRPKSFNRPTLNAIFGVDSVTVTPATTKERVTRSQESLNADMDRKPRRQVARKATNAPKVANRNRARTSRTESKLSRPKSSSQKQSSKVKPLRMKSSLPRSKPKTKTQTRPSSERLVIQRQNYNLKNCFRTWRQLSHEEKVKKKESMLNGQQSCAIPCSVILHRLEDMTLDDKGHPIIYKAKENEDSISSTGNVHDKCHVNTNIRKRKKKSAVSQRRKRASIRDKKKDIVDYYASMLESLRKKAQLLEENAVQNEITKGGNIKSETLEIEACGVKFRFNAAETCEKDDEDYPALTVNPAELTEKDTVHTEKYTESNPQNTQNEIKTKIISSTQDEKMEVVKMTSNFDSRNPDSYEEKDANCSLDNEKIGTEKNPTEICVQNENDKTETFDCKKSVQNSHQVIDDCSKSPAPNLRDDDNLKSPTGGDMQELTESVLEPITGSSYTANTSTEDTQSNEEACVDTDSSDVGCLVIDFESEQGKKIDGTSTEAVGAEKQYVEEKKSIEMCLPKDISDLMSDSCFKTKDIVLGFENELGADTVISTLSQADMDDMFLLEDDDDESPIGMIPEEEVEKLLGLDVTGDGEVGNSCKSQKDTPKCSYITSTSTTSPSISESHKLHWIPIGKEKVEYVNENPIHNEGINSQPRDNCSTINEDHSSSYSSPPSSNLQVPSKNHQISPSWNRLLGSEALKKMEKSGAEQIYPLSRPISENQNKKTSLPNVKMKLAGALSRALKLSAEMKRVLSDGSSSDVLCLRKSDKELQSQDVSDKKKLYGQLPQSVTLHAVEHHENDKIDEATLAESVSSNNNQCRSTGEDNETCERRRKGLRQRPKNTSKKKLVTKSQECNIVSSSRSDNESMSNSSHQNKSLVACADDFPESSPTSYGSNSSSIASSSTVNVRSKLLPFAKGIDLDKLKLKLNPIFSSTSGLTSVKSRNLERTSNSEMSSSTDSLSKDHHNTSLKELKTFETEQVLSVSKASGHEKINLQQKIIKKAHVSTTPSTKLKGNSEPSLITSKLCNILKNIKRPTIGSKQLIASQDSLTKVQNSSEKFHQPRQGDTSDVKNGRRLRSSPQLPEVQGKIEQETLRCSLLQKSLLDQDGKKKKDDDDKGERSFFDCLSDVATGAWEES